MNISEAKNTKIYSFSEEDESNYLTITEEQLLEITRTTLDKPNFKSLSFSLD